MSRLAFVKLGISMARAAKSFGELAENMAELKAAIDEARKNRLRKMTYSEFRRKRSLSHWDLIA